ncbi:MAG TPA: ATP-binding cassette domain-containing protein [bacterium]|nr:ATP-binding cassette domain-containing protein [bacterium]
MNDRAASAGGLRDAEAAPRRPLLRVEDIVKHFGGAAALAGLTLTLGEGEMLGITGPNGSGKTTLIDVIAGSVRPERGRVWLGTRDITAWPPYRTVRAGVARTFHAPRLSANLSVRQNLEAATLHRNLARRRRDETVSRALDLAGLQPLREREVRTLTLGEIRRVAVGRALATGAHVLLLDEPFASLGPEEIPKMLSALRRLRETGISVALVAHSYSVLQALCDRVVVIAAGRVVGGGPPSDLWHA